MLADPTQTRLWEGLASSLAGPLEAVGLVADVQTCKLHMLNRRRFGLRMVGGCM